MAKVAPVKRCKFLYCELTSFSHLVKAAKQAARSKKKRPYVDNFLLDLEPNILDLQRNLVNRNYTPGPYRQFVIREPKMRTISAATFRDRVVHHAICMLLEPIFECHSIFHSYACRKDKGMHRALGQARKYARVGSYFLKMDIAKFYDSIRHDILKAKLRRVVGDPDFLHLLDVIIDHSPRSGTFGLPIGNLTSQHFANFLLSDLDRHVKHDLHARKYLRYMDDIAIFSSDYDFLKQCRLDLNAFLPLHLSLEWQSRATILAPMREGLPFLGFRIFSDHIRLCRKNWRRFQKNFLRYQKRHEYDAVEPEKFFQAIESMCAHLEIADTHYLRRTFFREKALDL